MPTRLRTWRQKDFLEQAPPELRESHTELLERLRAIPSLAVRFDAKGPKNATYNVYVRGSMQVLWVYANGRLNARFSILRMEGLSRVAQLYQLLTGSRNPCTEVIGNLGDWFPEAVADLLQNVANAVEGETSLTE